MRCAGQRSVRVYWDGVGDRAKLRLEAILCLWRGGEGVAEEMTALSLLMGHAELNK